MTVCIRITKRLNPASHAILGKKRVIEKDEEGKEEEEEKE